MPSTLRRRAQRASAVLALLSLSFTQACYAYVPPPDGRFMPSNRVRVALTPEGTRELARFLGPGVYEAEGVVTALDSAETITLAVDFVRLANGIRMPWTGEGVVRFPAPLRQSVSLQTFQRRQTIVAAAAVTAFIVGVGVLALRAGGADGSAGLPPPPPP